jgi:hypothetical protein
VGGGGGGLYVKSSEPANKTRVKDSGGKMKTLEKQRGSARFQANEKENDVGRRAVVAAVVEFRDRIIAPLRVTIAVTAQQCV